MDARKGDILAQRLRQAVFGLALFCALPLAVVTAFGLAPGVAPVDIPTELSQLPVDMPETTAVDELSQRYVTQERVLRGDTVAALFERMGVSDPNALNALKASDTGRQIFRQLVPGRIMQAETGAQGELFALRYFPNTNAVIEVRRDGSRFSGSQRPLSSPPRLVYKTAVIRSSLFAATDAAGIPDAVAMQVARVFATDVDFHTELRKGDQLSVVYEMIYEAGELVAPGRIVAARFVNDGRVHHAVLFRDDEGIDGYYSLDGSNRAKAFLRSPVEFSRVSSGFGARFHPIFKNWRAHTGVDFAAPQGTRVLAAADGYVVAAGPRGGYGNAVEIRHGGAISTLYAHLSRFAPGIRAGARVRQGDPIAYVGATGFATGPHLHYEFKIGGAHQDPLRVALPKAEPVPARLKSQFMQAAHRARSTIEMVSAGSAGRFE